MRSRLEGILRRVYSLSQKPPKRKMVQKLYLSQEMKGTRMKKMTMPTFSLTPGSGFRPTRGAGGSSSSAIGGPLYVPETSARFRAAIAAESVSALALMSAARAVAADSAACSAASARSMFRVWVAPYAIAAARRWLAEFLSASVGSGRPFSANSSGLLAEM